MRAGDDDEMMHACCANPNLLHSWPSASQLGRIESPLDDDQSQSKRSISMVAAAAHVHLLSRGQSLKLQSGSMCSFTFHPPTIHPSALHYWWWRSRFPPSTTSHLVCHIEANHAIVSYLLCYFYHPDKAYEVFHQKSKSFLVCGRFLLTILADNSKRRGAEWVRVVDFKCRCAFNLIQMKRVVCLSGSFA